MVTKDLTNDFQYTYYYIDISMLSVLSVKIVMFLPCVLHMHLQTIYCKVQIIRYSFITDPGAPSAPMHVSLYAFI